MPEVSDLSISVSLTQEERDCLDRYLFSTGFSKKGLIRKLLITHLQEKGFLPKAEKEGE